MKAKLNRRQLSERQLASYIAKYEGKKHQATIGDIREIIRIIKEMDALCVKLGGRFLKQSPLCTIRRGAKKMLSKVSRQGKKVVRKKRK